MVLLQCAAGNPLCPVTAGLTGGTCTLNLWQLCQILLRQLKFIPSKAGVCWAGCTSMPLLHSLHDHISYKQIQGVSGFFVALLLNIFAFALFAFSLPNYFFNHVCTFKVLNIFKAEFLFPHYLQLHQQLQRQGIPLVSRPKFSTSPCSSRCGINCSTKSVP